MDAMSVAKMLFAHFVIGDTEGALELVHPDAVLRFPGDRRVVPWAGTYAGRDLKRFFDAVKDHLDFIEYTTQTFHCAGEVVFMTAHERCRVRATGKIFANHHAGILTVQEGLVRSYFEYADTAAIQAAWVP